MEWNEGGQHRPGAAYTTLSSSSFHIWRFLFLSLWNRTGLTKKQLLLLGGGIGARWVLFSLFGLWCLWRNRLCTMIPRFSSFPFDGNNLLAKKKERMKREHNRRTKGKEKFLYVVHRYIKGIIIKTNNNLKNSIPSSPRHLFFRFFFLVRTYVFPCYNRLSGFLRSGPPYVCVHVYKARGQCKRGAPKKPPTTNDDGWCCS